MSSRDSNASIVGLPITMSTGIRSTAKNYNVVYFPPKNSGTSLTTPLVEEYFLSSSLILRSVTSNFNANYVARREEIIFGTAPVANSYWAEDP